MRVGDAVRFNNGFREMEGVIERVGRMAESGPIVGYAIRAEGRCFHIGVDALVGPTKSTVEVGRGLEDAPAGRETLPEADVAPPTPRDDAKGRRRPS